MTDLTSQERIGRMYEHREADRIPMIIGPWKETVDRWRREGMPEDVSYVEYFDLDHIAGIGVDNSPRYPAEVVEETEEYVIRTTQWGATLRTWKDKASTPEFLDFTITDPDSWQRARDRMQPDPDRIPWDHLKKHYPRWKEEGHWIRAGLWFGFDVTHSWTVGTERLLMAMLENPEWCRDMFEHFLDVNLRLLEQVWDRGYTFHEVSWPDDMGYKHTQFFSLDLYRELIRPVHRRAIQWAHERGVKTHLHSCGDINPFVPELVEIGLDGLNPLEVKAGMDPVAIKKEYGDRLLLHGGINAVLWTEPEKIREEIENKIPLLKKNGGYIFSSDHSVPSSVSLEDIREILSVARRMGGY